MSEYVGDDTEEILHEERIRYRKDSRYLVKKIPPEQVVVIADWNEKWARKYKECNYTSLHGDKDTFLKNVKLKASNASPAQLSRLSAYTKKALEFAQLSEDDFWADIKEDMKRYQRKQEKARTERRQADNVGGPLDKFHWLILDMRFDSRLKLGHIKILGWMYDRTYADKDELPISFDELVNFTGEYKRSVRNWLQDLQAWGYFTKPENKGGFSRKHVYCKLIARAAKRHKGRYEELTVRKSKSEHVNEKMREPPHVDEKKMREPPHVVSESTCGPSRRANNPSSIKTHAIKPIQGRKRPRVRLHESGFYAGKESELELDDADELAASAASKASAASPSQTPLSSSKYSGGKSKVQKESELEPELNQKQKQASRHNDASANADTDSHSCDGGSAPRNTSLVDEVTWDKFEESINTDAGEIADELGTDIKTIKKKLQQHMEHWRELEYPGDKEAHSFFRNKVKRQLDRDKENKTSNWKPRTVYLNEDGKEEYR